MRLFLIYVIVELAVVVALVSTIGFGWTVLALLGTSVLGFVLAGSQVKRHIQRLRSGLTTPQGAVTDSALVALGTVLVFVPGLVTTAAGLLLLTPPTRAVARPLLTAMAARRVPLITVASRTRGGPNQMPSARAPAITSGSEGSSRWSTASAGGTRTGRGDYIDGEVIDVVDVEPQALPRTLD